MDEAMALMGRIVSKGPVALRLAMESVYDGLDSGFAEAMRHESALFGLLASTEDMAEGMGAFLEKRKADFKGR
jgi:enoyl-CoA hydratase